MSDKMESRMSLDRAGGRGFGEREGDPDSPWDQGKRWEGVCSGRRIAGDEGVCFLSRQRQRAVGCTEGGLARAQGLCSEARRMASCGKSRFTSPQLLRGQHSGATKPSFGCTQPPASITASWIDCHVGIVCKEFDMKLVTMNRSSDICE